MRRNSRELAFKLIYENIFSSLKGEVDFSLREDDFVNYEKQEFEFGIQIYKQFVKHQDDVLNTLSQNIKGYTLSRVYKIDLALLALAIVEHDFFQTPLAVVTNEVLELSKIYSTGKSSGFINGVISTIYGDKNVW